MRNAVIKISSVIFAMFLLLAVIFAFLTPVKIASADNTVVVIKAPVSNLEGNATAGKSTLKLIQYGGEAKTIIVPESYFVKYHELDFFDYHKVEYAGQKFYFQGEPSVIEISVSESELLYPDVTLTLKEDAKVQIGVRPITNEYIIKFLGYSEDGSEIFVSVLKDDYFETDFIPVDCVENFTVPYQQKTQIERDELLASKVDPPIIENGNFAPNTSVALRIVIIIGIAIPTILIVILLFKPSKNERRYSKNSVRNTRRGDDFDYDDSRSYRRRDERDDRYSRDDRDRDYDRRDDRDYDRRDYDDRDRGYDRDYDRR